MKHNLFIFITYNFLIKYILLATDFDLGKYQLLQLQSDPCILFDSSEFKIGEEIFIKITGTFLEEFAYIEYYFYDNESKNKNEKCNNLSGQSLIKEYYNKIDKVTDDYGNPLYEIRYFTIDKKKEYLGTSNGNYLKIFTHMNGNYDIENTEMNQGYARIVGIIIAVVVIVGVIIAVIVYCIYRRKRMAQFNQSGPTYNAQNVPVKNMYNNPNYAYPS